MGGMTFAAMHNYICRNAEQLLRLAWTLVFWSVESRGALEIIIATHVYYFQAGITLLFSPFAH